MCLSTESRELRAESSVCVSVCVCLNTESGEQRAESGEQRAESSVSESREQRAESGEQASLLCTSRQQTARLLLKKVNFFRDVKKGNRKCSSNRVSYNNPKKKKD